MRKATPWGVWDHIPLDELVRILDGLTVPWWIDGGFAIDAFAGSGRRDHDDIDVSLFHADHLVVQAHLAGWELHAADPPGTLRLWQTGEVLPPQVHDIWARRDSGDAWRFQLMLNAGGPDELVFRRDHRVHAPLERATWMHEGVRYLAPEWQLLFKSGTPRPKDEQDFADCLPLMTPHQKTWLTNALESQQPPHPWLARLHHPTNEVR